MHQIFIQVHSNHLAYPCPQKFPLESFTKDVSSSQVMLKNLLTNNQRF